MNSFRIKTVVSFLGKIHEVGMYETTSITDFADWLTSATEFHKTTIRIDNRYQWIRLMVTINNVTETIEISQ